MSLMGDPVVDMITRHPLFEGLDYDDVIRLRRLFTTKKLADGEHVTEDGAADPMIHVIAKGAVRVTKLKDGNAHELFRLGEDDIVGEMKLADKRPSSATVTAVGPVSVMSMSIEKLEGDPAMEHIHRHILLRVARVLAGRVRAQNTVTADAMARELEEARARLQAGRFVVYLLLILGGYSLVVSFVRDLPSNLVPSQALLSPFVILGACVPMVRMLKKSPYPLASYGITFERWLPVTIEAVLLTLPLLAAITLSKWALVELLPSAAGVPVFDYRRLGGDPFSLSFWIIATIAYCLVCPFQEFFTRAGLQGGLHKFLPARTGTNWIAIILSTLMFSTAHTHIGFKFALAAFLPGIFWGWLFERQRSLVGVTISHMLVGVWAISVLGVERFISS